MAATVVVLAACGGVTNPETVTVRAESFQFRPTVTAPVRVSVHNIGAAGSYRATLWAGATPARVCPAVIVEGAMEAGQQGVIELAGCDVAVDWVVVESRVGAGWERTGCAGRTECLPAVQPVR